MDAKKTQTTNLDAWRERSNLQHQEMDERKIVLKDHQAKWHKIWQEFYNKCEVDNGGHQYIGMPDNGINQPHFITGEWPMMCKFCNKRKQQ